LDYLPDEDIDSNSFYPVESKTVSGTSTKVQPDIANRNPKLTQYIKQALIKHHDICAKDEFDIGKIPNSEFRIVFKKHVDTTPIKCKEYPHNIRNIEEIERQLE